MAPANVMEAAVAMEPPACREEAAERRSWDWPGPLMVRPLRAGDSQRLSDLIRHLSPEARLHRFHVDIPELPVSMRDSFASYDRRTELVLVATAINAGREVIVAEARHAARAGDAGTHEVAVVVHQAFRRRGLGETMLRRLVGHARDRGLRRLVGDMLHDNHRMLALSAKVGFARERHPDHARLIRVALSLDGHTHTKAALPASVRIEAAGASFHRVPALGHHTEVRVR